MSYLGSWKIDDLLTFVAVTQVFSTGVATDADSAPAYRVYEDETTTPILTGTMALLDGANTAGLYSEQITLSAANGFEKGKCYSVHIAATVSSVAGATVRTFQIEAEVDANRINWANVDNPTTAVNLSATNIDTDQVVASVAGAVGSVTGAVGSVAGLTAADVGAIKTKTDFLPSATAGTAGGVFIAGTNAATTVTTALTTTFTGNLTGSVASVSGAVGSVTGAVGSVGAGGIAAATFAAGAIDAAALSADAGAEIADAVLNRDMSTGTDSGSTTVRTMRQALRFLRNKWSISGTTLTVTKEDDTTASWTSTVTTDASSDPITANDPAGP